MKQQSMGILLSALLCTIFGHEVLHRHQAYHTERKVMEARSQTPHSNPVACSANCYTTTNAVSGSGTITTKSDTSTNSQTTKASASSLNNRTATVIGSIYFNLVTIPPIIFNNPFITINATTGLIFVSNVTANFTYAIDVNSSLVAVFKGSSGDTIILDYQTSTGKLISGVWNSSQEPFIAFISSLTSLSSIYQKNGQTFNSSNVSTTIKTQLLLVLTELTWGEWAVDTDQAFDIFNEVTVEFAAVYKILIPVLNSQELIMTKGLIVWTALLKGFAAVIAKDIPTLLRLKIKFDLWVLTEGAHNVLKYILGVYQNANITLFKSTDIQAVLTVIANLGGNITTPAIRAVNLFIQIIEFIKRTVNIENFVEFLIEYYLYTTVTLKEFTTFFVNFKAVIDDANSGGEYTNISREIDLIIKEEFTFGSVNVSEVILVSIQYRSNRLVAICAILYELICIKQVCFDFEFALGQVLESLVLRLPEKGGLRVVIVIVGTIHVNEKYLDDPKALLKYIISGIHVLENQKFDIYNIPVIGDILRAFDRAFTYLKIDLTILQVISSLFPLIIKLIVSISSNQIIGSDYSEIGSNGTIIGSLNHNGEETGGITLSDGSSTTSSWTKIITGEVVTESYTSTVSGSGKHHGHGHVQEKRKA